MIYVQSKQHCGCRRFKTTLEASEAMEKQCGWTASRGHWVICDNIERAGEVCLLVYRIKNKTQKSKKKKQNKTPQHFFVSLILLEVQWNFKTRKWKNSPCICLGLNLMQWKFSTLAISYKELIQPNVHTLSLILIYFSLPGGDSKALKLPKDWLWEVIWLLIFVEDSRNKRNADYAISDF